MEYPVISIPESEDANIEYPVITIRGLENDVDSDIDTASTRPLYNSPVEVSEDDSQETPNPMGNPSPETLAYQNIELFNNVQPSMEPIQEEPLDLKL